MKSIEDEIQLQLQLQLAELNDAIAKAATYSDPRLSYGYAILRGLNTTGKHIYGGTVPEHVIDKRRAKDKVAKASRKANR